MNGFRVPIADEALWREMEKEQIRLEIISGKIERRRELEEEVGREMAMERAFGIPIQRYLAAPYPLQEQVNPFVVDHDMNRRIIGEEIKPSSSLQINKDRVIVLPKPNLDLLSAKRKAETPAVYDTMPSAVGLRKKAKEEWRCAVCQISVTSERQLNDHQRGKRHKAKEAALKTQMTGESTKACMSKESETATEKAGEVNSLARREEAALKSQLTGESTKACMSKESETATEKAGEANSLATREEVRKELALGIPMQKCLAAPASFQEPMTKCSVPMMNPLLVDDIMDVSEAHPAKIVALVEIKRSSEIDKSKVIMLAKPDPDLYNAKQKAEAPAVYGTKPSELVMKKKLEEWSCSLCQVSTTSERGLMEHMYGKKHKAKEAALRTQKIDKSTEASLLSKENEKGVNTTETIHTTNSGYTKADRQMPPPFVTLGDINGTGVDKGMMESSKNEEQLVEKSQTTGGLKNQNQNETTIEEVGELSALRKRKEEKEELAMESALGIQCLAAPFPFQEPVAKLSNPIMNSIMVDAIIGASQLQLPQIVTPVEIKPSPQIDNGKAILLAKCDTYLHGAKQNAVAPAVDGTRSSESVLKEKPKEEWSCAICGVSTTSEKNLNDHLHSRKHKAKQITLEIQEAGKSMEASLSLKESEKGVKAADAEVFFVAPPTLDPKILAQFPQPSFD